MSAPSVVVVGAGAVGSTLAGWLTPHVGRLVLVARGPACDAIRAQGLILVPAGDPSKRETFHPAVVPDVLEAPPADVVVLAVKTFDLDVVAARVRERYGDAPLVVGVQNGLANQAVLPRHFRRVVYGVVGYNAWVEAPGVVGWQRRGPLVLGALDADGLIAARALAPTFDRGLPTSVTERLGDVVHTKLVVNLANAATTLVGHTLQPLSDTALFQRLLSRLLWEGVQVVRAAGYREARIPGLPPWRLLWASAHLPPLLTRPLFERNLAKMVLSSMAQDVLVQRRGHSELDEINGALVALADRYDVEAPLLRALTALCRREFQRPDFAPWDVRDVWAALHRAR